MKARTIIQKQIVELRNQLPDLTLEQKIWAHRNAVEHVGYRSKKGEIACSECGSRFQDEMGFEDGEIDICPCCGCKLEIETTRKRSDIQREYFTIITTVENFQVIRHFYIMRTCKADVEAKYEIFEVVQWWLLPSGDWEVITKDRFIDHLHTDLWFHEGALRLRKEDEYAYHVFGEVIYPERKYIPILKRNGFKGKLSGESVFDLLHAILSNPKAETLLKAKQMSMLSYLVNGNNFKIDYYWQSIKICIRNKYKIKDASLWVDYLELLEHFGKDIHSNKYICPRRLLDEHNRLMKRKLEEDRKLELEKLKQSIEKAEINYQKVKGKFLKIKFHDDLINVSVLQNVREFEEEGYLLQHCVFSNAYYAKEDSLVLSARIGNRSVETIEVSLKKLSIIQARGKLNKDSEYHSRIIKLVKQNIGLVKMAM